MKSVASLKTVVSIASLIELIFYNDSTARIVGIALACCVCRQEEREQGSCCERVLATNRCHGGYSALNVRFPEIANEHAFLFFTQKLMMQIYLHVYLPQQHNEQLESSFVV
jgi:hypothetical protein